MEEVDYLDLLSQVGFPVVVYKKVSNLEGLLCPLDYFLPGCFLLDYFPLGYFLLDYFLLGYFLLQCFFGEGRDGCVPQSVIAQNMTLDFMLNGINDVMGKMMQAMPEEISAWMGQLSSQAPEAAQ